MKLKIASLCALAMLATACPTESTDNNDNNNMTTMDMAKMDMAKDDMAKTDMTKEDMSEDDMKVDMGDGCTVEASGLGPVATCDEAGATACFANKDCADNERCENIGGDAAEVACCVEGPRGCKVAGDSCESEFDCDEGLCISRNSGPYFCSKRCMANEDCPSAVPECHPALGLCVQASN